MPVLLLLAVGACVIPPSLSVDNQDAGTNAPPAITAVRAEDEPLVEADPDKAALFTAGEGSLSISLLDPDTTDTLYVRIFVNYTLARPENFRASCVAGPSTTPRRTATCDVGAVCFDDPAEFTKTHNMTVHVFDRMPLDEGEPRHMAMPEGGLSASKFFFLRCQGRTM